MLAILGLSAEMAGLISIWFCLPHGSSAFWPAALRMTAPRRSISVQSSRLADMMRDARQ